MFSSSNECATFLRSSKLAQHHIQSSIWLEIKECIPVVLSNTSWVLGDGNTIKFWSDRWLSQPIVDLLNLPPIMHKTLNASVAHFIVDNSWVIPSNLIAHCPDLVNEIKQINIPKFPSEDQQLVWNLTDYGILSFKSAYQFCKPV